MAFTTEQKLDGCVHGIIHFESEKLKTKDKLTFTKLIMSIIMILYFLGAILGGLLVILSAKIDVQFGAHVDPSMFIAFATYIGGPTATAIGFYAWKSKAENLLKIKNSTNLSQSQGSEPEIISTLANMEGN